MWTLFRYCYRDTGNFKAFGSVALSGAFSPAERSALEASLEPDGLFVAEQVGLPALYEQLYQWSDGPTVSDYCWHEFVSFQVSQDVPHGSPMWGSAAELLARFVAVETWDGALSPHFAL